MWEIECQAVFMTEDIRLFDDAMWNSLVIRTAVLSRQPCVNWEWFFALPTSLCTLWPERVMACTSSSISEFSSMIKDMRFL